MILTQARAIRTSDTGGYAWANLRRFQNVSFVQNEIIRLHNLAPRWHRDAHKQAMQLRYCLTQAREYSNAAPAVPHCSAHGLRKATARRLAEAGCTMHEIAAITGHASLSEVQRYTKAADQARLARAAMDKAK
jgi:integrase